LKEDEPHTLYYYLAKLTIKARAKEPNIEVEEPNIEEAFAELNIEAYAPAEPNIILCRTIVSQTLTFCLMALNSKSRN